MIALEEVIDFEAAHPQHTFRKQLAIRELFETSSPRYYLRLHTILSTEQLLTQALRHDPQTTNRLLTAQAARAANRITRRSIT